jgi:phosphoribosylaminoimidazole-succinocarboxamide synthase
MDAVNRVSLPYRLFKRGKVRDVFEVDNRLLIVSTDRISAFDYVLPSLIPGKGKILNQISLFWFRFSRDLIANHVVCDEPHKLEGLRDFSSILEKRSILAKKLTVFPVEAIVRGYIVGSGWKTYQQSGEICGVKIPKGMKFAEKFPEPIFTPTTKADAGHDENMTFEELQNLIGKKDAETIREQSIELYQKVSEHAADKGIIIADTKFEFGQDEGGDIVLVDEIFTPDSSRFWKATDYEEKMAIGEEPPAFDKQYVRNFLLKSTWNRKSPPPELPQDVVRKTAEKYGEIYRILTGKEL